MLRGAEIVLQCLRAEGIDLVFGYPGGAIMPLYDALEGSGIKHILTRHEQGAVFAAEGVARVSRHTLKLCSRWWSRPKGRSRSWGQERSFPAPFLSCGVCSITSRFRHSRQYTAWAQYRPKRHITWVWWECTAREPRIWRCTRMMCYWFSVRALMTV